ncbi:MAG: hypothetical protein MK226_18040 [Saprospiraceae bacterium]|nr:hypothetical protein [Saprospiraceae bacterium]
MNENQFYTSLEKDLSAQRIIMNKAIDTVLNQEVTNYPIVVLHQADVELGVLLMDGGTVYSKWEIRISSLEEMVAKKVMRSDRVEDFRKVYKDPESFFCLLVLQEEGMQFIFMPRYDQ